MTRLRRLSPAAAVLALGGLSAEAQDLPCPAFRANTFTTGNQRAPVVAAAPDGGYLLLWTSEGQDGSGDGVFGRLYDGAAVPRAPEFRVNTATAGGQVRPEAAFDADGDFVVVWDSPDGSYNGVFGQRFTASGAPQGPEFRVNTYTTHFQIRPSVASDSAGNFVVVWTSYGQDGSGEGVYGQRYDSGGNAQGGEFRVNTATSTSQTYPAVAAKANGEFVVVWHSDQDGSPDVFGQRFDAQAGALGGEFRINTYTSLSQTYARVAYGPDGGFVAVWDSFQDGSGIGVYSQRFDPAGAPAGPEQLINAYTTGLQFGQVVAGDRDRGYVVAWTDSNRDGSAHGVFGRRLDVLGQPIGSDFRVNTFTPLGQTRPAVAATPNGGFVVAWESEGEDGSGTGVFASLDCARFYPLNPCRLADTRTGGGPLPANTIQGFVAAGSCGIPADARAVALNVTAVNPTAAGNLRVFPGAATAPLASTLNFAAGRTRANNAIVLLGGAGQLSVRCDMPTDPTGSTHLVLDAFGYFKR